MILHQKVAATSIDMCLDPSETTLRSIVEAEFNSTFDGEFSANTFCEDVRGTVSIRE